MRPKNVNNETATCLLVPSFAIMASKIFAKYTDCSIPARYTFYITCAGTLYIERCISLLNRLFIATKIIHYLFFIFVKFKVDKQYSYTKYCFASWTLQAPSAIIKVQSKFCNQACGKIFRLCFAGVDKNGRSRSLQLVRYVSGWNKAFWQSISSA